MRQTSLSKVLPYICPQPTVIVLSLPGLLHPLSPATSGPWGPACLPWGGDPTCRSPGSGQRGSSTPEVVCHSSLGQPGSGPCTWPHPTPGPAGTSPCVSQALLQQAEATTCARSSVSSRVPPGLTMAPRPSPGNPQTEVFSCPVPPHKCLLWGPVLGVGRKGRERRDPPGSGTPGPTGCFRGGHPPRGYIARSWEACRSCVPWQLGEHS